MGLKKGCCKPGDQGINVIQVPIRGEGVHKGWMR